MVSKYEYSRLLRFMMSIMFSLPKASSWIHPRHIQLAKAALFSSAPLTTSSESKVPPSKFVPVPFHYHQELDITIDTLTNRGLGIGRVQIEHSDKPWVVMVPNVIPGEVVRVRVFRNFPNYSEADLSEIVQASPDRVQPLCPLSAECGGCQFQHINIDAQRKWKTSFVEDALKQFQIYADVKPCYGTEHIFGYRSKLTPHYNAPAKSRRSANSSEQRKGSIREIGFQRQSSRQLIDVENCPIATPEINAAYVEARKVLSEMETKSKLGATLLFRQANLQDSYIERNHKNRMTTTVNGLRFTYLAGNFFQNNYYVLPKMVDDVLEAAKPASHLIDCYCGSGLFAVAAAASNNLKRVVGIEINDKAIIEATYNAKQNEVGSKCEFVAASSENLFAMLNPEADNVDHRWHFPRESTAVVLDPPRKGCSQEFLDQLLEFAPTRIVYMSCDPMTQARDAVPILQGGYEIVSVQPYDLFPQTRHIECLIVFQQRKP